MKSMTNILNRSLSQYRISKCMTSVCLIVMNDIILLFKFCVIVFRQTPLSISFDWFIKGRYTSQIWPTSIYLSFHWILKSFMWFYHNNAAAVPPLIVNSSLVRETTAWETSKEQSGASGNAVCDTVLWVKTQIDLYGWGKLCDPPLFSEAPSEFSRIRQNCSLIIIGLQSNQVTFQQWQHESHKDIHSIWQTR